MKHRILTGLLALALILSACAAPTTPDDGQLNVVVTTNILGDVVATIGGEHIHLTTLLPPNTDPHSYQATPQDLAALESADVVFVNGFDLEEGLLDIIASAAAPEAIVTASDGVTPRTLEEDDHDDDDDHDHGAVDPHVWMDPANVAIWADNIAAALSAIDPAHAADYQANAAAYQAELDILHQDLLAQVATIPAEKRLLVADHDAFGYLAQAYGFELIGTIFPGLSPLAEPSAQELAQLHDLIAENDIPALFIGLTVNPTLAERLAEDTGAQVVALYTGSLSAADGPAPTYLDMMRFNIEAIVAALAP